MALQVVTTTIGLDLTLQIAQIIQNHYLRDFNHY